MKGSSNINQVQDVLWFQNPQSVWKFYISPPTNAQLEKLSINIAKILPGLPRLLDQAKKNKSNNITPESQPPGTTDQKRFTELSKEV